MNKKHNSQEEFWIGDFGNEMAARYQSRDFEKAIEVSTYHFSKIFRKTTNVTSLIELGCNIGINLHAIHNIFPTIKLTGVDINKHAISQLVTSNISTTICSPVADLELSEQYDFILTKAFLIHINSVQLDSVYEKIFQLSKKYICLCEFYNPEFIEVIYRGHSDVMFKRDYAGEFLDLYPSVRLIDYGFMYHRDPEYPDNDITWFLLEKTE